MKKKTIFAALKEIIIKKGLKNIRMDEIAKKAGIAKGTIYLYFKSKDDLLLKFTENFFVRLKQIVNEAKETKGTSIDKLKKFIQLDLMFFEENIDIIEIMVHQSEAIKIISNKSFQKKIHQSFFELMNSIAGILKDAISEGHITGIKPLEGSFILLNLINSFGGIRIHNIDITPLHKKTNKVLKIFLRGVGK